MRSILVRSTRALTSDRHQHHPLAVTSAVIRLHATANIIDTALKQLDFPIRYSGFDINLHLGLGIMAQLPVPARSEQLYVTHSPSSAPDWKDWLAALRHTLGMAARYRDKTPKNPARAIHICRARVKEARALLRLAPPSLRETAKACRNELAAAARIISAPRDAFVVSETLKELVKDQDLDIDLRDLPSDLLKGASGHTNQQQHRALLQQTASIVHDVSRRIATWPAPVEDPAYLLEFAEKSWRRARRAVPDTLASATPDEMHEFRKMVITCRYQTAFFNGHHRVENSTLELSLEKLRKSLGKLNDLYRLETELFRFRPGIELDIMKTLLKMMRQNRKVLKKQIKQSIKQTYFIN